MDRVHTWVDGDALTCPEEGATHDMRAYRQRRQCEATHEELELYVDDDPTSGLSRRIAAN